MRDALGTLEPVFRWMLQGELVSNLHNVLQEGYVRRPPPRTPLELTRIQTETEQLLEDEGAADWG